MFPEPSTETFVGFTSPVIGIRMVWPPDEWLAGIIRSPREQSVTYISPLGSNAKPVTALNAHGVTVGAQGSMQAERCLCR